MQFFLIILQLIILIWCMRRSVIYGTQIIYCISLSQVVTLTRYSHYSILFLISKDLQNLFSKSVSQRKPKNN